MKLTPALSAYLDFLRFTAALAVLVGHLMQDGFAVAWIPLAYFSHEAVIVFFVMSGYIVYTSTVSRRASAREYVIARVSRIYSVALPAVVFCVALSALVAWWWPEQARDLPSWRPFSLADIASSLLFMNQSWNSGRDLTLNGPYWSLCYEVWYYLLFGLAFFVRGPWRWPLVLGLAVVAGPSIIVLFPIWVMGAWLAARERPVFTLSAPAACAVWVGAIGVIVLINMTGLAQLVGGYLHNRVPGFWRLEASQGLFTDYVVALALAAHLCAYPCLPGPIQAFFVRTRATWATLAGFSFTLYLFHRPMTRLAGTAIPESAQTVSLGLAMLVAILGTCWLIAFVTERQLPAWRRLLRRLPGAAAQPVGKAS